MSDDDHLLGETIEGSLAKYVVDKKIGTGGYGTVYMVHDDSDKTKMYAMKLEEKVKATSAAHGVRLEFEILTRMARVREGEQFPAPVDRGQNDDYFILVMQLVGKSLFQLKNMRRSKIFSISTGLRASLQCLKAAEQLHSSGYIHRDIKPANYACGLGDKKRVVYMLDFGIARKYVDENNAVLRARDGRIKFKGTVPFASLACHRRIEQSPKDDCESWFYLMIDLIQPEGLPWRDMRDEKDVILSKETCRTVDERAKLFGGLGDIETELGTIMDHIVSLQYEHQVDYNLIYEKIKSALFTSGASIYDKYDWEMGEKKKEKEEQVQLQDIM